MSPDDFRAKWGDFRGTEKAGAQSHFNDLCDLLGLPKPNDAHGLGDDYVFEKSLLRLGERRGFADVWRRDCFAWEYKKPSTDQNNLVRAYKQLKEYADGLHNPPLLIVSDIKTIRIHTQFTGYPAEVIEFDIHDLNDPGVRRRLAKAWTDPESFRPEASRELVTTRAAAKLGTVAAKLARDGRDPQAVAHFLNRLVFCMFVEDIGLLPDYVFAEIMDAAVDSQDDFVPLLGDLFRAMKNDQGRFGTTRIPWFNGGLFDDDSVIPLNMLQIRELRDAAQLDWTFVEPAIFGTLFEKGLDPEKREAMAGLFDVVVAKDKAAKPGAPPMPAVKPKGKGAAKPVPVAEIGRAVGVHYTDVGKIRKIVEPVVLQPLEREWATVKAAIAAEAKKESAAKSDAARKKAIEAKRKLWFGFRQRLKTLRVLDPACGSGNFLYVSLLGLKDFDKKIRDEAKAFDLIADQDVFTTDTVLGIEVNPYAAELARVTIWIGDIQWDMRNGAGGIARRPILGRMDGIRNQDALIDEKGRERQWPAAECIVGNPPFLGGKRLRTVLKDDYVDRLFSVFTGRVSAEADLVCYWFEKARAMIEAGQAKRVGLVSTNSIRGGANRKVLDRIVESQIIYDAWADEPWEQDGAAVRVSLICYTGGGQMTTALQPRLDGREVTEIHSDLSAGASDLTTAVRLSENVGVAFMGDTKGGAFDIPGSLARTWLQMPSNPNGRPNADVLKPWVNGRDITSRPDDKWIVDFGWKMSEAEASLYERPFEHVRVNVKPKRDENRRESYRDFWWRHVEARQGLVKAISGSRRFIVTPRVSTYRLFVWFSNPTLPDSATIVIARDDDTTFGILHSRFHEIWALRMGTSLEDRPRYTPTTTFETFPFPEGLTPDIPAKDYENDPRAQRIAAAARKLNELRENWLNPPELVRREPEVVPGYPDRLLPRGDKAAAELKKRTLTNLYNQRPAWLDLAHKALDEAVAAAYGWPADLSDDEILSRLLALNHERAAKQGGGIAAADAAGAEDEQDED